MSIDRHRVITILEKPDQARRQSLLAGLQAQPATLHGTLWDLVVRHPKPIVRARALASLNLDTKTLQDLALHDPAPDVRLIATERLKDTDTLTRVALEDRDYAVPLKAVDGLRRLTDLQGLVTIGRTHRHADVRIHARRAIKRVRREHAELRAQARRALWRARFPKTRILLPALLGLAIQLVLMTFIATWVLTIFMPLAPPEISTRVGFIIAALLGAGTILFGATPASPTQLQNNILKQTGGLTLTLLVAMLVLV